MVKLINSGLSLINSGFFNVSRLEIAIHKKHHYGRTFVKPITVHPEKFIQTEDEVQSREITQNCCHPEKFILSEVEVQPKGIIKYPEASS